MIEQCLSHPLFDRKKLKIQSKCHNSSNFKSTYGILRRWLLLFFHYFRKLLYPVHIDFHMSFHRFHILACRFLYKSYCIYLYEKLSVVSKTRPIQLKQLTLSLRRSLSWNMTSLCGRNLRQKIVNTLQANVALLISLKK